MFKRKLSPNFHTNYHLFTLLVLVVGVVCSKFLMSLGLMLGGLGFLLELDFKSYRRNLQANRLFWWILAFYLLHFVALIWSENYEYGWNDIRVKFSLVGIALISSSRAPFSKKSLTIFYVIFVLTLVISTIVNYVCYQFFGDKILYVDIRDLSLFGSHIRFGILIALGVSANYFLWNLVPKMRWFWFLSTLWLTFYTYYSQVLSGVISLAVVVFVLLIWELYQRKRWGIMSATILFFVGAMILVISYLSQPLQKKSAFSENQETLKHEWDKRSSISFDTLDLKKQQIRFTLERYLISKRLPIRGDGVLKLTQTDIENIEKGNADINEMRPGLTARLYGLRYQIHHSKNPNGHSLLERLEYWKTAISIIKENWLIGVGTGDVNASFLKKYEEINSPLLEERRLRAHNTYLTETVTFGIVGLLFFITWLSFYFYKQLKFKQLFGIIFILVAAVTFAFEDTLETQMGITFFALFYSIFSRKMES